MGGARGGGVLCKGGLGGLIRGGLRGGLKGGA